MTADERNRLIDEVLDKHVAYSPPIWTPELSGQWMQVASVYNSATKSTTHYLNGKQISRDILPDDLVVEKVRIGAASIGNWSELKRTDPHFAVRNINGAIDEFAIFSGALTSQEITDLYEKEKPENVTHSLSPSDPNDFSFFKNTVHAIFAKFHFHLSHLPLLGNDPPLQFPFLRQRARSGFCKTEKIDVSRFWS